MSRPTTSAPERVPSGSFRLSGIVEEAWVRGRLAAGGVSAGGPVAFSVGCAARCLVAACRFGRFGSLGEVVEVRAHDVLPHERRHERTEREEGTERDRRLAALARA